MDKTKHPDGLIILTYAIMAFSRAGKDLLTFPDMVICGISGLMLGFVVTRVEKLNWPVYICRGIGAFFAAVLIIGVWNFTSWTQTAVMIIIAAMIPPVAAGAMLVEGLCTAHDKSGRQKMLNAILVSICLAVAVFVAVAIMKAGGMTV